MAAANISPTFAQLVNQGARPLTPATQAQIEANIILLMRNLKPFDTIEEACVPENEVKIREAFTNFLKGCGFEMALRDFEQLINEKTDPKTGNPSLREDGTISWFHELSPILMIMSLLVKEGKRGKILNYKDINKMGGLETLIRTHLRHDSVEDTALSMDGLTEFERLSLEDLMSNLTHLPEAEQRERRRIEEARNRILIENVRLMSRKEALEDENGEVLRDENGKIRKINHFPRIKDYIGHMLGFKVPLRNPDGSKIMDEKGEVIFVQNQYANPSVFLLKLGDGIHNLGTLLGSPKFTVERRTKYCNERENMHGSRDGFTDRAMSIWPDFASAIHRLDCMMGAVLYLNFNYMQYVDLSRPDQYQEGDVIYPSGIAKYMKNALEIDVPGFTNPLHLWLRNVIKQAQEPNPEDPARQHRIRKFLDESVFPALQQAKPDVIPATRNGKPEATNGKPEATNDKFRVSRYFNLPPVSERVPPYIREAFPYIFNPKRGMKNLWELSP